VEGDSPTIIATLAGAVSILCTALGWLVKTLIKSLDKNTAAFVSNTEVIRENTQALNKMMDVVQTYLLKDR